MSALYTHGATITLTPEEFSGFTVIRSEPGALKTPVNLVLASAGTADMVASLGVVKAYVTGSAGDDMIATGSGNDELYGGLGNDGLNGGFGDDVLYGGLGVNSLYGADGNDWLISDGSGSQLFGGAGNDHLVMQGPATFHTTLYGGDGDDTITGGLDGVVFGGAGNDLLVIYGQIAADGVAVHAGHIGPALGFEKVSVSLALLSDLDDSFDTRLVGSAYNATVMGGAGNDTITSGTGRQYIDGGVGADSMTGGSDSDVYVVDNLADVVVELSGPGHDKIITTVSYSLSGGAAYVEDLVAGAGAADLRLEGNVFINILSGGAGNDTLIGNGGNDSLTGGGGFDQLFGGSGHDRLTLVGDAGGQAFGGEGNDSIEGSAFADTLDGGAGADYLVGGEGGDTYFADSADTIVEVGTTGIDTVITGSASFDLLTLVENLRGTNTSGAALTGNGLDNRITGAGGNDTLDGSSGNDTLVGGAGDDTYLFHAGTKLIEAAGGGIDTVVVSLDTWHLGTNFENLTSTSLALSHLYGNASANVITSGGSAVMFGYAGNDVLNGGAGNDTLDGGTGADTLAGGAGDDLYVVDNTGDQVSDTSGFDTVLSRLSVYTLGAGIEALYALSSGAAKLTGNGLDNVMDGNVGNDTLYGWDGNDTLAGDIGADSLLGGAGDDVLIGQAGHDTLSGSWGHDAFVFDTADLAADADVITDYSAGVDLISLKQAGVFDALALGWLAAGAFKLTGQAEDAGTRIIYDTASERVSYDADGSGAGAAVVFATLANHASVTAGDFWVY